MTRPVSWALVGLLAYLIFAVATFPADTAYRWFAPDEVVLVAPAGTVWSGQAAAGTIGGLSLTEPKWTVSPWQLFLARLGGQAEARVADGLFASGFSVTPGGTLRLADTRFGASIQSLAGVLPVFDTRGQLSVDIASLVVSGNWPESAEGLVRVGNLEVAPLLPTASGAHIPLGNFEATLATPVAGEIVAAIRDTGGPLEVAGTLTLRPDRSYLLDALVRPRPEAGSDLRQGLEFMGGPPNANGMHELQLSGSL